MHLCHIYFDKITNISAINESDIVKKINKRCWESNALRYNLYSNWISQ
jgi:hypothetical protein